MKFLHTRSIGLILLALIHFSCQEDTAGIYKEKLTKEAFEVNLLQIARKDRSAGEQLELIFKVTNLSEQDYLPQTKADSKPFRCRFILTFTDGTRYTTAFTPIPSLQAHSSSATIKIPIATRHKTYQSHQYQIEQ